MGNRKIVVDTSVARAAGKLSKDRKDINASKSAREILNAIRTKNHTAVFCEELSKEWDIHQSNFSRIWRVDMISRKRIDFVKINLIGINNSINLSDASPSEKTAMRKDAMLLQSALQKDRIIISFDFKARKLFKILSKTESSLNKIQWCPASATCNCADWIESGVKYQKGFFL